MHSGNKINKKNNITSWELTNRTAFLFGNSMFINAETEPGLDEG